MAEDGLSGDRRTSSLNLPPEVWETVERIRSERDATFRELLESHRAAIGPARWDALNSDLEQARLALKDEPTVRQTALFILMSLNQPTPADLQRCEELAEGDPDDDVREVAIIYLGRHYKGTSDRRMLAKLASYVLSAKEPEAIRMVAYRTMIAVTGQRLTWDPPTYRLRCLRDVDWSFVGRYSGILTEREQT